MKQIELPWREAFESYAAMAWTASVVALVSFALISAPDAGTVLYAAATASVFAVVRWSQAVNLWNRKLALKPEPLTFIKPAEIKKIAKTRAEETWLGKGFPWTMEHTQLAFQLRKSTTEALEAPIWYQKLRGVKDNSKEIGQAWIHGINNGEEDQFVPIKHLESHTLILGTTGSGKTRAFETLILQSVLRGDCVFVVDPKGDKDMRESTQRACALAGRPEAFMHFHPAFPEMSVRYDPMRNWNRPTELASRVVALMASESTNDPFKAFSWRAVNLIVQGLIAVNDRPNLRKLRTYIELGADGLLDDVLTRHFDRFSSGWAGRIHRFAEKHPPKKNSAVAPELQIKISYYKEVVSPINPSETASSLISMVEHSRDHLVKMIASLLPILEMLTTGAVGELLSPTASNIHDPRPITDGKKTIQEGQVIYIGTDSLSDATVGSAIASIILADLASVAGERYNYGLGERRVALYVDEACEAINQSFIQLLNKGRGAHFSLVVATQTYPDFIAKMGNDALARQILGNINNLIALRSRDGDTQEYITETFGTASILTTMHNQSTTAMSGDKDPTNFTGSYGERLTESPDAELVSSEILGMLPNLHYFASLSGGRVVKGRLPIVQSDIVVSLQDIPWVHKYQHNVREGLLDVGLPNSSAEAEEAFATEELDDQLDALGKVMEAEVGHAPH